MSEIKEIEVSEELIDRYSLKNGDVLFTEGGDYDKLGRGTVWQGQVKNCLHQNHVFVVRPYAYILNPYFLSYQASSRYGKQYFLKCSKQTTNLASINSTQLKGFQVLMPTIEEYISTKWYNLFFENNTFFQEKRFGISISDTIDCYYTEGELQFTSFYFARQVFDLSDYYRSATDVEVASFATCEKLSIEEPDSFKKMANTWIRRKIAMINDSQVLVNYTASEIKALAAESGIDIDTKEDAIVIPDDKDKVKVILGFLDEEAYKGPFSQKTYLANSKRPVKK